MTLRLATSGRAVMFEDQETGETVVVLCKKFGPDRAVDLLREATTILVSHPPRTNTDTRFAATGGA